MSKADKHFFINDSERNLHLPNFSKQSNYIQTTKYTFLNFLPLSLIYQFKREANIYFVIQAILNSIPIVSAMNPVSAYIPLVFVLGVSMVREGIEDYQRYKSDKLTNRQQVFIVRKGKIQKVESKDIKVGDILVIMEDQFFPADMVLLASSNENASCFVKTSSLDGETAPKVKKVSKGLDWAIPSGGKTFHPDEFLVAAKCHLEAPHSNLYAFDGRLELAKQTFRLTYE